MVEVLTSVECECIRCAALIHREFGETSTHSLILCNSFAPNTDSVTKQSIRCRGCQYTGWTNEKFVDEPKKTRYFGVTGIKRGRFNQPTKGSGFSSRIDYSVPHGIID